MKKENNNYIGRVLVIAAYKPKTGKEKEFLNCLKDHVPILRKEGYVTEMNPLFMRSKDGSYLEIFVCNSQNSIKEAHSNPIIIKLWKRFDDTCIYKKLSDLDESYDMFANFYPVILKNEI